MCLKLRDGTQYRSSVSDKKPFCLKEGGGEKLISFVGGLYLPARLPGSVEVRQEKAERIREEFGSPEREVKKLSGLFAGPLRRSAQVGRFFLEWENMLPDLSGAYRFLRLEGDEVYLEALNPSWLKRKKFDEARIEKVLNEYLASCTVKVKIAQNTKK